MKVRSSKKPTTPVRLDMKMEHQEQDFWCWAAVTIALKKYYRSDVTLRQCDAANFIAKREDCCLAPSNHACNSERNLEELLGGAGILREQLKGCVSLDRLRREIDQKHPVACRIEWQGGAGHFVCIDGYEGSSIFVKDPSFEQPSDIKLPYDEFCERYLGRGAWTWTYLTGV